MRNYSLNVLKGLFVGLVVISAIFAEPLYANNEPALVSKTLEGLNVILRDKAEPSLERPRTFITYKQVPNGRYVYWQVSEMGFSRSDFPVKENQVLLELLLLLENPGSGQRDIVIENLSLASEAGVYLPWETVFPGIRKDMLDTKVEVKEGVRTICKTVSKDAECTLSPGQKTFVIAVYVIPEGMKSGVIDLGGGRKLDVNWE